MLKQIIRIILGILIVLSLFVLFGWFSGVELPIEQVKGAVAISIGSFIISYMMLAVELPKKK